MSAADLEAFLQPDAIATFFAACLAAGVALGVAIVIVTLIYGAAGRS